MQSDEHLGNPAMNHGQLTDDPLLELVSEMSGIAVWEYNFAVNAMLRTAGHDALYGLDWQVHWNLDTFLSATHPDDREAISETIAQSVAPEGPDAYEGDFRVVRPDGSIRWLWVRGQVVVRDEAGRGQIVRGVIADITGRKEIEEQLRNTTDLYRESLMATISSTMTLGNLRDPYTAGHERRVGEFAYATGEQLGLNPDALEGLRLAGYMHDVGKFAVPSEILARPSRLSAAERILVETHPRAGYEVLSEIPFPWPIALVALQHHERLDGTGYPEGLSGDEIIPEARILAVADVFEAMSSHRPYRPALGSEAAIAELESGAGTRYDPRVVTAFLTQMRENGLASDST